MPCNRGAIPIDGENPAAILRSQQAVEDAAADSRSILRDADDGDRAWTKERSEI